MKIVNKWLKLDKFTSVIWLTYFVTDLLSWKILEIPQRNILEVFYMERSKELLVCRALISLDNRQILHNCKLMTSIVKVHTLYYFQYFQAWSHLYHQISSHSYLISNEIFVELSNLLDGLIMISGEVSWMNEKLKPWRYELLFSQYRK